MAFALLMLLGVLAGCKKETPSSPGDSSATPPATDGGESSGGEGDTTVPLKELPTVNYNNYQFRIITRKGESQRGDFFVDSSASDAVSQAVYVRNMMLKDKYGIVLAESNFDDENGSASKLASVLESGEDTYDLIVPHGRMCTRYAVLGYCTDWYSLPYQNLTYDWWSQGARDCFTINDRLYFMVGDMCHSTTAISYCVMFNKQVFEDNNEPLPYDDVKAGTWTFEKMAKYAIQFAEDSNGDGKYELGKDRLGYMTLPWGGTYCSFFASGNRIVQTDANGSPYISIATESAQAALTAFFELVNNEKCYQDKADWNNTFDAMIRNGQWVFYDTTVQGVTNYREVDIKYGILPYPHTNDNLEDPTSYVSHTAGAGNVMIIPYTAPNLERTSVALEALAQYGRETVIPVYYSNIVEKRTTKDYDDYEMLSVLSAGRIYDLGYYDGTLDVSYLLQSLAIENFTNRTGATIFYSLYNERITSSKETLKDLLKAYSA